MIEKNKFAKYVLIVSFSVALIAGLYFGYDYLKEKPVLTPVPGEPTSYKLTHTQEDAEYILNWDVIGSHCPGVNGIEKTDIFVRRGETVSFDSGQSSLPSDSQQAWTSSCWAVIPNTEPDKFHSLGVSVSFFDSEGATEEHLKRIAGELGADVQEEGEFMTAIHETLGPTKSRKALLTGNHILVTLDEIASSGEQFFCGMEDLGQIVSSAQKKISSLEITPLPPQIPAIEEKTPLEWNEVKTVRSEDVLPYVKVSEGEFYNELWFEARPLKQGFNFTTENEWRIVITATGEVGTKVEVRWTITRPAEPDISESEVFQLSSQEETHIRPDPYFKPRGTHPPGDVEIEIFAELPIGWVVKIERAEID